MHQDLQQLFAALRFSPTPYGGMEGKVEDVEVTAIEDPLNRRVILTFTHVSTRRASQFQLKLSPDASLQEIARVLVAGYEYIHADKSLPPDLLI